MNIYYLFLAICLVLSLLVAHFCALKKCAGNDWWRVAVSLIAFFLIMLMVSAIPIFKLPLIVQNQWYSALFFRSVIEEMAKIVFCYVVFETLEKKRIKRALLAFCALVALYESSETGFHITSAIVEGYLFLTAQPKPDIPLMINQLQTKLGFAELFLFVTFQVIRIYLHFYLTYVGVRFLMTTYRRWLCVMPILAHGLLNQAILFISIHIENMLAQLILQSLGALLVIAIMICLIKRNAPEPQSRLNATLRINYSDRLHSPERY
ncbi:hypothetical protein [Alteromonas sp. ASW11-130]|uniref:hypothetical protein n=1 Tax=Alteromonas sp. ASW11-130 TaxID=3015775 RepID=UPI002241D5E4|nr:hypothetical protein [Alteromonas sp. ASW11-130]MCW8091127.1 hypothetical protein [Alteromonas sp. ASW11-130]